MCVLVMMMMLMRIIELVGDTKCPMNDAVLEQLTVTGLLRWLIGRSTSLV